MGQANFLESTPSPKKTASPGGSTDKHAPKKRRRKGRRRPQLVDRDDEILKHVGRYYVSLESVIHELFWSGSRLDTCQDRLQLLEKELGVIARRKQPGRVYLTSKGAKRLLSLGYASPSRYYLAGGDGFGLTAETRHLTVEHFCTKIGCHAVRQTEATARQAYLQYPEKRNAVYFLNGRTWFDLNINVSATPRGILDACFRNYGDRKEVAGDEFITALIEGHFRYCVLVPNREKMERIVAESRKRSFPVEGHSGVLKVAVVPGILNLYEGLAR